MQGATDFFRFLLGGAILFMAPFLLAFSLHKIPPKLEKKLYAAVEITYGTSHFKLIPIPVKDAYNAITPVELGNENLFSILQDEKTIGFAYLGQAPSKKNTFDYVVFLEPDLRIKKSKILIYREDHGRQIGSQRWLKQFIGRKPGDTLIYGETVDAISGATISASSMTRAVQDVLTSLKILRDKKILK